MKLHNFEGKKYVPIFPPTADSAMLSEEGERLVVRHTFDGPELLWAPKREITNGWVVGIAL